MTETLEKKDIRIGKKLQKRLIRISTNGVSVVSPYSGGNIPDTGSRLLVEIRVHGSTDDILIRTGGYKPDDDIVQFGQKLCRYCIDYFFRDSGNAVCEETIYPAETKICQLSENNGLSVLILDVNANVLKEKSGRGQILTDALEAIISAFSNMDWKTEKCDVFRVWQSSSQMPQDKVEFPDSSVAGFAASDFIHLSSFTGCHETSRVRNVSNKALIELDKNIKEGIAPGDRNEYVFLTNRLIENLFDREWFENEEELPGLRGIPLIIFRDRDEKYEIGTPKATQVNDISLSEKLYKEKVALSDKYDYLVFNRYTDSRIYIDVKKSDYGDHGRVKNENGPAKKVMLPRYYRLMLGYGDEHLETIREEEYEKMLDSPRKDDFNRCYCRIQGQPYYKLLKEEEIASEEDKKLYEESVKRIQEYLDKDLGVFKYVNLIEIPKTEQKGKKRARKNKGFFKKLTMWILKLMIGKSEYILKTVWAGETDDKNDVARLNSNMMSLLGITENDKIQIHFGDKSAVVRVLPKDELSDYEIGVPSSGRRKLGMNNINDIVTVHRDMKHTFSRHSQEQTIAILGTVLAVAQVMTSFSFFTDTAAGILIAVIVCIVSIIAILYFALSEERVKVRNVKDEE